MVKQGYMEPQHELGKIFKELEESHPAILTETLEQLVPQALMILSGRTKWYIFCRLT
jgi:hypothetical protein